MKVCKGPQIPFDLTAIWSSLALWQEIQHIHLIIEQGLDQHPALNLAALLSKPKKKKIQAIVMIRPATAPHDNCS